MQPLYALASVEVAFDKAPVLRAVSGSIAEGGFLGVIGPNGAGKTTFIRVLSGMLRPTAGEVRLNGAPLGRTGRRELARTLAVVPCSLDLPVAFTVAECVGLGRMPYLSAWGPVSEADRLSVRLALECADLVELADRPFHTLSGGERQRTLVAMALAQEPRILLLDEPTAHLDLHHAWDLMALVSRLHRERRLTVVLSSHDLNLAGAFCSELLLLERGRVRCWDAPDVVLRSDLLSEVYGYPLDIVSVGCAEQRWVVPRRLTR